MSLQLPLRAGVPGAATAGIATLEPSGRRVILAGVESRQRRGALDGASSETIAAAARLASELGLPLVVTLSTSGVDVHDGVAGLHGWGRAALALAGCSGRVPVIMVVKGAAMSGPALLLGMADAVITTPAALAYVSGPAAVAALTGMQLTPGDLGGAHVHGRLSGLAALHAESDEEAMVLVDQLLSYLPDNTDLAPATGERSDPAERPTPELRELLPASATGSYDVRDVCSAIGDHGEVLELRPGWAPQLVTALIRVDGFAVGVVANQPRAMAGTLDIAASQKGAKFVAFCDTFNLPLLTLVDTPGFMPGKDLEWRGMIRHGAQLVFSYAQATVPRICLILRKAYGGAYIVMDSKNMGNDICLAWPGAEVAVMGAEGAVQILHRRADAETQARLVEDYRVTYLNPYRAAERGFVDEVIDPAETRSVVARSLALLVTKREHLTAHKHGNGPL